MSHEKYLSDVEIFEHEGTAVLYQLWNENDRASVEVVGEVEVPGQEYRKGNIKPKFYDGEEPAYYMWSPSTLDRHEGQETSWIYGTGAEALEVEEADFPEIERILESAFNDEPLQSEE